MFSDLLKPVRNQYGIFRINFPYIPIFDKFNKIYILLINYGFLLHFFPKKIFFQLLYLVTSLYNLWYFYPYISLYNKDKILKYNRSNASLFYSSCQHVKVFPILQYHGPLLFIFYLSAKKSRSFFTKARERIFHKPAITRRLMFIINFVVFYETKTF